MPHIVPTNKRYIFLRALPLLCLSLSDWIIQQTELFLVLGLQNFEIWSVKEKWTPLPRPRTPLAGPDGQEGGGKVVGAWLALGWKVKIFTSSASDFH